MAIRNGNYALDGELKLRPSELYIACDGMDFSWYPAEVERVIADYNTGLSLAEMAANVGGRDIDELFILLLDLARQGKIKARPGGVLGG